MGWPLVECLKIVVKSRMLENWMYLSENGVPRIMCLISAAAKGIMKCHDFLSIDEKQALGILCLIGSSDWLAKCTYLMYHVDLFLQMLRSWVITT